MKNYYLREEIRLKYDEPSGKFYAFCIESGDHFELNKTGYFILTLIEKKKNFDEIIEILHAELSGELINCEKDINDFLAESEKSGIIALIK